MLIYIRKEQGLGDVEVRILTAVNEHWGEARYHGFPAPGALPHAADVASFPAPDMRVGGLIPPRWPPFGRRYS